MNSTENVTANLTSSTTFEMAMDSSAAQDNLHVLFHTSLPLSDQLRYANENGVSNFNIIFKPQNAPIPMQYIQLGNFIRESSIHYSAIKSVKFTRNKCLLISCASLDTALELLQLTHILNAPVSASVFVEEISTRFLLHDIPIDIPLTALASELHDQNIEIITLRRFMRQVNGSRMPSTTVLVTMLGYSIPSSVTLWLFRQRTSLFIDRPRECYNCYQFGHSRQNCKAEKVCEKCAGHHDKSLCTAQLPSCARCQGGHPATASDCPVRLEEQKLLVFQANSHCSISEARRRWRSDKSFATIVKNNLGASQSLTSTSLVKSDSGSWETALTKVSSMFTAQLQNLTKIVEQLSTQVQSLQTSFKSFFQASDENTDTMIAPTRKKSKVHTDQPPMISEPATIGLSSSGVDLMENSDDKADNSPTVYDFIKNRTRSTITKKKGKDPKGGSSQSPSV